MSNHVHRHGNPQLNPSFMKRLRKLLLLILGITAIYSLTFLIPFTATVKSPRSAVMRPWPSEPTFGLRVWWWNRLLRDYRFHLDVPFDSTGHATVPPLTVDTNLGRFIAERLLTGLGLWPGCAHCDGPWSELSLYHLAKYQAPPKQRLIQSKTETPEEVCFSVSLIPDESQYEERKFVLADHDALISACQQLIKEGSSPHIERSKWGPAIEQINPVRVVVDQGAVVLWMGGKSGYAIAPDKSGCPAFNRLWISGTEHPDIFRLNEISSD